MNQLASSHPLAPSVEVPQGDIGENAAMGLTPKASVSERVTIARRLCNIIVLPKGKISSNERSLACDMLLQVTEHVDLEVRVEIAKTLARLADCPPALARAFICGDPEEATPFLQGAEAISEPLLIEAARAGDAVHRRLIAARYDITSATIDVLIEANEAETALAILRRPEVNLSPFAIELLVERSADDLEMQGLLLKRRELEPCYGFMMFWWVSGERRRRILTRFAMDRGVIQDALRDLYASVLRQKDADPFVVELLEMSERRRRPRGANGENVPMEVVKKVLAASYRNPSPERIEAISIVAGVSKALAGRILRDEGGEPFAVLCKALGLSREDFYAFIEPFEAMSDNGSTKRADDVLAVFDMIARDFSRAVLRYWDWKGNPRIGRFAALLNVHDEFGEI